MKRSLVLLVPIFCVACQTGGANNTAMSDSVASESKQADVMKAAEIKTEVVQYTVDGQSFTGYLAYDPSITEARPGVLVVHEWWGHNDYARTRAEKLAGLGYTALALDMYGSGKVADHPDNAMAFMKAATKDPAAMKARFLKASEILQQHSSTDPDKLAAIGYCFGGGVVLNMARAGVDLDGVASFHGSLAPTFTAEPGAVDTKVMVFNGADDAMVTAEQIAAFKTEMAIAEIDYEFINYPGAKHSFTNPGSTAVGEQYGMPLAYDAEADQKSWAQMQAFFAELWPSE